MTIETCHLTKLKDTEQFNALIQTMIDDSKSLDTEQSAKRIGIIFNGSPKTQAAIDGSFDIIKKTYGVPFELFTHYQNVQDEEFINIIVSGMKLPVDDIKGAYDRYKKQMEMVDRAKDSFFDKKFDTGLGDEFDAAGRNKMTDDPKVLEKEKGGFFAKYGIGSVPKKEDKPQPKGFVNTTKNEL